MIRIDHIQIAMPKGKEPAARRFWCDLIGLTELEKPKALKARGGVWFALDGAEIPLGVETPFRPAKKAHPGLVTADLNPLSDRLRDAGYPVRYDDAIAGRIRFFTEDPFGNRLEFLQG